MKHGDAHSLTEEVDIVDQSGPFEEVVERVECKKEDLVSVARHFAKLRIVARIGLAMHSEPIFDRFQPPLATESLHFSD
jgi:hypothetical protein